jgi:ParB-like chromosome segregation protein Spo0J
MRLTELEGEIQGLIAAGKLGAGHGKALLMHSPGPGRISLAKTAAVGEMPVRRLESLARRASEAANAAAIDPLPGATAGRLAVVQDLERQLSQQLGTKVKIVTSKGAKRGVVKIEFYGIDHFDGLLARLGLKAI